MAANRMEITLRFAEGKLIDRYTVSEVENGMSLYTEDYPIDDPALGFLLENLLFVPSDMILTEIENDHSGAEYYGTSETTKDTIRVHYFADSEMIVFNHHVIEDDFNIVITGFGFTVADFEKLKELVPEFI